MRRRGKDARSEPFGPGRTGGKGGEKPFDPTATKRLAKKHVIRAFSNKNMSLDRGAWW